MPKAAPTEPRAAKRVARQAARRAGLVYSDDARPGIRRVRRGKGFSYKRPRGGLVRDQRTLDRIRGLAIPPAYTDVWINPDPRGHLQVTGRDLRGRKQYRYHPQWNAERGSGKFDRIVAFGQALPKLRRRVRSDLADKGFARDKVCAVVLKVLANTLIRIGNDDYARVNGSFGLTTLHDRHVRFASGGIVRFQFVGKGGKAHDIGMDDARLAKQVRACQQLPGQQLFQYRDQEGRRQPMTSTVVNDYLHKVMGKDFTSKDFRTYAATLNAFRLLAGTSLPRGKDGGPPSERALATAERAVVEQVAQMLGNTPAVCRKAYIDPAVFEGWRSGELGKVAHGATGARQWEASLLRFLKRAHRRA